MSRTEGRRWRTGWIALIDIVAFSVKAEEEQERCLHFLLAVAGKLLSSCPADDVFLNPAGDGVLLAADPNAVRPALFLDWTESLVAACMHPRQARQRWHLEMPQSELPRAFHIRAGTHAGTFFITQLPELSGFRYVVGRGPNECRRIADYADGGRVLVSQKFLDEYEGTVGIHPRHRRRLFPQNEDQPLEVPAKHRRTASIRLLRGTHETAARLRTAIPHRLSFLQKVDAALHERCLEPIAEIIDAVLMEALRGVTRSTLSTRVSILAPSPDGGHLQVTRYRHHWQGLFISQSHTRYAIRGKLQGLPGFSFHQMRPLFINALPRYKHDPAAYALRFKQYNLQPEEIRRWQRQSRAFLAVPFHFGSPLGVLCVDWGNSLQPLGPDTFQRLAQYLQQKHLAELAYLWLLRTEGR